MWKGTGFKMRISIASGKGGTGKSSLSVSLASYLTENGTSVDLYDCDVEEPNCHLILPERKQSEEKLSVQIPGLTDSDSCTECGECAVVCRFNALASIKTKPIIFPELCHSCGGCIMACPHSCISWVKHEPAVVRESEENGLRLIQGVLNIGEAQATRVIRKVLKIPPEKDIQIIDSPPGTSCSFMASVGSADFILLVTEPTPFGLHDLKLALAAIRSLNIPYGIIENKAEEGVDLIQEFCTREGHPLLMSIPYARDIAEHYSRGETPFHQRNDVTRGFELMMNRIRRESA